MTDSSEKQDPYRPDPEPEKPDLGVLGYIKVGDRWKPFLERYEGKDACKNCRGYGNGGNPLCGAVYVCKTCNGTGRRPPKPDGWLKRLWKGLRRGSSE